MRTTAAVGSGRRAAAAAASRGGARRLLPATGDSSDGCGSGGGGSGCGGGGGGDGARRPSTRANTCRIGENSFITFVIALIYSLHLSCSHRAASSRVVSYRVRISRSLIRAVRRILAAVFCFVFCILFCCTCRLLNTRRSSLPLLTSKRASEKQRTSTVGILFLFCFLATLCCRRRRPQSLALVKSATQRFLLRSMAAAACCIRRRQRRRRHDLRHPPPSRHLHASARMRALIFVMRKLYKRQLSAEFQFVL